MLDDGRSRPIADSTEALIAKPTTGTIPPKQERIILHEDIGAMEQPPVEAALEA